jgi:hypothetical protein
VALHLISQQRRQGGADWAIELADNDFGFGTPYDS